MAETAVMLRVGVNEADLIRGTETAKSALKGLTTQVEHAGRQAAVSGEAFATRFIGRTQRGVGLFNILQGQLVGMTASMTGLANVSPIVGTALYSIQMATSSLLGPVGMAITAVAGLAAVFGLKKVAVAETSKTLADNIKKVEEISEAQRTWTKDMQDFQANAPRYNKVIYALLSDVDLLTKAWAFLIPTYSATTLATDYASKKTKEFNDNMRDLVGHTRTEIEMLSAEGDLIISKSIPNLKKMISLISERRKELMLNKEMDPTEWHKQLNVLLEKQAGYEKQITDILKEETDATKKLREEQIKIQAALYKGPEMKPGFGKKREVPLAEQMLFGTEGRTKFAIDSANTMISVGNTLIIISEDATKKRARDMVAKEESLRNAVQGYVNSMAGAFANMMVGVQVSWSSLLQSMAAQLLQSGLTSLIMGLFPGGGFFSKLFTGVGFQYGTSYVPKTGLYPLHRGEAVIPASQNISNVRNYGGATNNYYLINLDVEKLTRRQIIPTIERLAGERRTKILTA